jgi:ssDNA-binding Zn-finger/Zn-ribbon topoisomerase 1
MSDTQIICPDCGAPMKLRETKKFTYPKSGKPRLFYGCTRWPECNATHGAHPDGKPLGHPANTETKALRSRCHRLVDELTTERPKGALYAAIADALGMSEGEIHFGNFDKEQCEAAIKFMEGYAE